MSKLKDRILESAWELFREKGYEKVSLRAIAEHAGTTVGNLTYHYPQKEDLLLAMQISTQGEILARVGNIPETPEAILEELHSLAADAEERMLERSFYFKSLFQLAEDLPSLRDNIGKSHELCYKIYLQRFEILQKAGFMREDIPDTTFYNLTSAIVLCFSCWLMARQKFSGKIVEVSIAAVNRDLIFLCLTPKGRDLWQKLAERERTA